MESHDDIRRNCQRIGQLNEQTVVKRLEKYFDPREIHTVRGILEVNFFEVTKGNFNLRALFPTSYLMSHNCVPNTIHTNDDKLRLKVRASVRIAKGETITTTYAYTLQGTTIRRTHLKETKFFDCTCDRCSDPYELGTNLSTLSCPTCRRNTLVASSPLINDASWTCENKKCIQKPVSRSFVDQLVEEYEKELKSLPEDVEIYENWIKRAKTKFHENHYLIVGVKYTLSLLYGKVPGFMIHEMDDDLLKRKIEICEELLQIANVIEPGKSRLRGLILYELHAPLMVLFTRKNEMQRTSKKGLKHLLKRVVLCLREACDILKFDGENTMEGKIGYAAEQALASTQQWEKILGTF